MYEGAVEINIRSWRSYSLARLRRFLVFLKEMLAYWYAFLIILKALNCAVGNKADMDNRFSIADADRLTLWIVAAIVILCLALAAVLYLP